MNYPSDSDIVDILSAEDRWWQNHTPSSTSTQAPKNGTRTRGIFTTFNDSRSHLAATALYTGIRDGRYVKRIEQKDTNLSWSLSSSPWHQSYLLWPARIKSDSTALRESADPSPAVCRILISGLCLARLEQVLSKLMDSIGSESLNFGAIEWKLVQPQESLTKIIEALSKSVEQWMSFKDPKEEAPIRDWLLSTRTLSQTGTPVGISQSSPFLARIHEGPAMVREGSGTGNYISTNGSRSKWATLQHEWRTGRPQSQCRNTS
ncbi:BQ5605_C003g01946 [Microbotryum silenes-dioicae]|uniref:BQ5605_C003g01946 protein n=1 Tax=Microbotryum silenes-dioicae TaxID=796604 RepID=A0A2X0NXL4_9BASI|nr:BQ5605_C003g01946 [Microbotryum silenes-dioicae]